MSGSDDSMSRREFLKGAAALGLLVPASACIGDELSLKEPCVPDSESVDGARVTCPDGLQGAIQERRLCIDTEHGRECYDEVLRFGFGTDLHYADRSTVDDTLRDGDHKLHDAVTTWNDHDVDFAVMAGDYIDGDVEDTPDNAIGDLKYIEEIFDELEAPRHYVLGNHDLDILTKSEFLEHAAADELYYSFDRAGYHFVVLDLNYEKFADGAGYKRGEFSYLDTWISPAQLEWLERDLEATDHPTLVFTHQRLSREGMHFAENADEARAIFDAGDVRAVFEGHSHENENTVVDDTQYFCMEAMAEETHPDNAYAIVHLYEGDYLFVEGFGGQKNYLRAL